MACLYAKYILYILEVYREKPCKPPFPLPSPLSREYLELAVEVCPLRPSRKEFTHINEHI